MQNAYEQSNLEYFNALKALLSKTRGFVQMLEAHSCKHKPKYAYLLQWIDEVLPAHAKCLPTKQKCYWVLNGLTDFPKCKTCGKQIHSSLFLNVVYGYRTYCCNSCAHKCTEYKLHLSQSQKAAVANDPLYYMRKAAKGKLTRLRKNNGLYYSDEQLAQRRKRLEKRLEDDPLLWKKREEKRKSTNIRRGHSLNWNNARQAVETKLSRNNGKYMSKESQRKKKATSLEKYGVDDPSRSETVKLHKALAFESKYGEGIRCWFLTHEARDYMKSIDEQRKEKERATKRKHRTFNTSKQEEDAYHMLHLLHPHLVRLYSSKKYPFACDFYDPLLDIWYECNFSWTHGGHWFDENNEDDLKTLQKWKDKRTKYYDNAVLTWTIRDVKKRKTAMENNLNYIVFWSISETRQYVCEQLQKCASCVNKNVT